MTCQEIANHTADYLTGDLDRDVMGRIQSHLVQCATCRSELEGLSETWASLGVLPEVTPGPLVRAKFYAMLEAYALEVEERRRPRILRFFARPQAIAPWAVAAALILAAGFALGLWVDGDRDRSRRSEDVSRMNAEIDVVRRQNSLLLVGQPSAADRLQGVALLSQTSHPDLSLAKTLFDVVDNDPNINVRLSAVEALYLSARSPQVQEGVAASLARQSSPLVQIALIDLLVAIREKHAADALRRLIDDQQFRPEVRQRAESAAKQLL